MHPHRYTRLETPVGELTLERSEAGLCAVLWDDDSAAQRRLQSGIVEDDADALLNKTKMQLREYFAGKRMSFDLPLAPVGTLFQKRVWELLTRIPFGETVSYGELAARTGDRKKARAVGAANGKNPIAIIVPCHRVIGADGTLTGFAGGLEVKRKLLDLEKRPSPL